MSVRKVTKVVWECICNRPTCVGRTKEFPQGTPWYSKDDKIPERCNWCGQYTWNRTDKRKWKQVRIPPDAEPPAIDTKPLKTSGSKKPAAKKRSSPPMVTDAVATSGARLTIARPAGTVHAPRCTCNVCTMGRGAIKLPTPKRVRGIE